MSFDLVLTLGVLAAVFAALVTAPLVGPL